MKIPPWGLGAAGAFLCREAMAMAGEPAADDEVSQIRALLVQLSDAERALVLAALSDDLRATLECDWPLIVARQEQLSPPGDSLVWLVLARRGFGKTRSGAEWVPAQVKIRAVPAASP